MKIITGTKAGASEKVDKLKDVLVGEIFRFPNLSFEEAIAGHEEPIFFMVINKQPSRAETISIMSLDGKVILERDLDRDVIKHKSEISIYPNN